MSNEKRSIEELLDIYHQEVNHRADFELKYNIREVTRSLYSQYLIDFDERTRLRYHLTETNKKEGRWKNLMSNARY